MVSIVSANRARLTSPYVLMLFSFYHSVLNHSEYSYLQYVVCDESFL